MSLKTRKPFCNEIRLHMHFIVSGYSLVFDLATPLRDIDSGFFMSDEPPRKRLLLLLHPQ